VTGFLRLLAFLCLCVGWSAPTAAEESLTGRLLVAQPSLTDPNFSQSVVFIVRHDDKDGAFGLIVNRFVGTRTAAEILELFGESVGASEAAIAVHAGGPVQRANSLVLHSGDYAMARTERVDDRYGVSPTVDAVIAHAEGRGPSRLLVFFGYAGWAPGQLDAELATDAWAVVDADDDLVFASDPAKTWDLARSRIAVDL